MPQSQLCFFYWFIAVVGILPAVTSGSIYLDDLCNVVDGRLDDMCFRGLQRASPLLKPYVRVGYLFAFVIGIWLSRKPLLAEGATRSLRHLSAVLALTPLLGAALLAQLSISAVIDLPQRPSEIGSLDEAQPEYLDAMIKVARAFCSQEPNHCPASDKLDTKKERLAKFYANYLRLVAEEELQKRKIARLEKNEEKYKVQQKIWGAPLFSSAAITELLNKTRKELKNARSVLNDKKKERADLVVTGGAADGARTEFNNEILTVAKADGWGGLGLLWRIYVLASIYALARLLWSNRLNSVAMITLFSAVVVSSLANVRSAGEPGLPEFLAFASLIATAIILRLAFVTVKQNRDLWATMTLTPANLAIRSVHLFKQCFPIIFLILLGFALNKCITNWARDQIYDLGKPRNVPELSADEMASTANGADASQTAQQAEEPVSGPVKGWITDYESEPTLEGDVIRSLAIYFEEARKSAKAADKDKPGDLDGETYKRLEKELGSKGKPSRQVILDLLFDKSDSRPLPPRVWDIDRGLKPEECDWFLPDVKCFFRRAVKKEIDHVYRQFRDPKRDLFADYIKEKLGDQAPLTVDEASALIVEMLTAAEREMRTEISRLFYLYRLSSLVAWFSLALVLIRALTDILARNLSEGKARPHLSFDTETGLLAPEDQPKPQADFRFAGDVGETFYIRRGFDITGAPDKLSWPQPTTAVVRRILGSFYAMNQLTLFDGPAPAIRMTSGRHLIEIKIKANNRIYFDPRRLFAFTDGIRLAPRLNLRFVATPFHRLFHFCAEGEGRLLLICDGIPDKGDTGRTSVRPDRIVAWSGDCSMMVRGGTRWRDIYLSGSQVSFADGSYAVVDVQTKIARPWLRGGIRLFPIYLCRI